VLLLNFPITLGGLEPKISGLVWSFFQSLTKTLFFRHPSFNEEFKLQCLSLKIAKKGKRPDFQALIVYELYINFCIGNAEAEEIKQAHYLKPKARRGDKIAM
jgi:hypothetical protein